MKAFANDFPSSDVWEDPAGEWFSPAERVKSFIRFHFTAFEKQILEEERESILKFIEGEKIGGSDYETSTEDDGHNFALSLISDFIKGRK